MRMIALTSLSLLVVACAGTAATDDKPSDGSNDSDATTGGAEIQIDNPTAGAEFDAGQAIPLDLSATKDGRDLTPTEVTWTIGDWTGMGVHTEVSGLAPGDHTVNVTATVDGQSLNASTSIHVIARDLDYAGPFHSTLELSDWYASGSATCDGTVSLVVTYEGTISGTGDAMCTWSEGTFDVSYVLDGQMTGGTASGTMSSEYEGRPLTMNWNGSGAYGSDIQASFDFSRSDGTAEMRLSGTFSASPQ